MYNLCSTTSMININQPYFGDIVKKWLQDRKVNYKASTVSKYTYIIDTHILPDLGDIFVSDINTELINEYINKKIVNGRINGNEKLSASYVRTIIIIINSAYNYGVSQGICTKLASNLIKPALKKKKSKVFCKSEQEKLIENLLQNLTPTKTGILLSLYAGLRIGEVCALKWEDVNLNERILTIRHSIVRSTIVTDNKKRTIYMVDTPKTHCSMREIPISSALYSVLTAAKACATSEFMASDATTFITTRTFENRYKKIIKSIGIENINYHALRHTFATRCIEKGGDIKSLSEILGHSNTSITLNTYVHSSMEQKRIQIEKVCW